MAFVRTDLGEVAVTESGGVLRRVWVYVSTDTIAAIQGVGYFADAGSTSGDGTLSAGDVILAEGNGVGAILRVTDAAAGTAGVKVSYA